MSLTSHLAIKKGPVREWFERKLPDVREVQAAWRAIGVPSILPSGANPPWGYIGAAFDYRLRYYFTVTDPANFVAALGGAAVDALRGKQSASVHSAYRPLATELTSFVANRPPVRAILPQEHEQRLDRLCYILALFEAFYRAAFDPSRSPLASVPDGAGIDDYLALVPTEAGDDIAQLMAAFVRTAATRFADPVIANPVFSGSRLVGGADADLIADRTLVEIKTTKETGCRREWIYQLIGYVLLDFNDRFKLRRVAFYVSRAPGALEWDVDELLLAMGATKTLAELRGEFGDLLEHLNRRVGVGLPARLLSSPTKSRSADRGRPARDQA